MNKKGFTLVELLAVIAVLAILVIIALPNVLRMYNNSKKNIFLTETKSIVNTSESRYITEKSKGITIDHVSSLDETKLDLNNNSVHYNIKLDNQGKMVSYIVSNEVYCIDSSKSLSSLTIDDVLDKNCSILNDLLGRDDLENEEYLTDRILGDNNILSDVDIDFKSMKYIGSKYSIDIGSVEIDYTVNNDIVYYYGVYPVINNDNGRLTFNSNESTEDLITTCNSVLSNGNPILFCEGSSSCETMYSVVSVKDDNTLSVQEVKTIANERKSNGNGMYYNTDSGSKIYYFRGNVQNNYVKFGNILWRIVRFNDDYSIRLITNTNIGSSAFNNMNNDNAYVGYMYGNAGSDSYEKTHANKNDSVIKTYIDSFYETNLNSLSKYIADSGFYGDRSLASTQQSEIYGYGGNLTFYSFYDKYQNGLKSSFKCSNKNDFYTVSNTKGNTSLKYPIGLLSVDEAIFAGAKINSYNGDYYLYNSNSPWFLMDAIGAYSDDTSSGMAGIAQGNIGIYGTDATVSSFVRPVINLKNDVIYRSGNGTASSPYEIVLR